MSRRVVIGIIIVIILGVLGGIAALVIFQLQPATVTPSPLPTINPNILEEPVVEDPTADSDSDGLSNSEEKTWGTDPHMADTDKDGFIDGVEVQKNHNPTIASPNDKLPPGFVPQQNVSPSTTAAPGPQSFSSLFSESVDVTGGSKNLTQEYAQSVPDKDKTPLTLTQFIQAQPITTTLPKLNDSAIVQEQDVPIALSQYMSVAGDISAISDKTRLSLAVSDFLQDQNVTGFGTLADRVASYQAQVQSLRVPPTALEYHKLLLGYCELLAGTFRQISGYSNDQIKALVALRQLDAIDRQYYPLIVQERSRLLNLSQ